MADHGMPPREVNLMTLLDVADMNAWERENPPLRALLMAGFQLKPAASKSKEPADYEAFYTQILNGSLNGKG